MDAHVGFLEWAPDARPALRLLARPAGSANLGPIRPGLTHRLGGGEGGGLACVSNSQMLSLLFKAHMPHSSRLGSGSRRRPTQAQRPAAAPVLTTLPSLALAESFRALRPT